MHNENTIACPGQQNMLYTCEFKFNWSSTFVIASYKGHVVYVPNQWTLLIHSTGLILALRPANERRRYFVTTSLIGWAQA